jgi:hypothetical protein
MIVYGKTDPGRLRAILVGTAAVSGGRLIEIVQVQNHRYAPDDLPCKPVKVILNKLQKETAKLVIRHAIAVKL